MIDDDYKNDEVQSAGGNSESGVKRTQKGFDDVERLTLRIDAQEAIKYQARKNKKSSNTLPKNAQKLRTKVRQLDDDEDEDEDLMDHDAIRALNHLHRLQINQNDASNADSSLINALVDDERRQIMQSTTIEISRQQENAGRHNALEQADTMLRKANLDKMTTQQFMNEMKDAIYNPSKLRREALAENIAKQMGIEGKIVKHSEGEVVEGIKKVKQLAGNRKVNQVKMEDVQKMGQKNMTQNETAELILIKSGQTARLSEIKHQSKTGKTKGRAKGQTKSGKSYSAQMKELLRESLKKNDKAGR
ncbi:MAG: hypothetical protein IKN71_01075 [Alphaproteobacteria bacterium]|nr:hypothetical protein [Alphaproteobacteria bacterium]